jgi:2-succinyl-5-enolpyruvyl-6-hydroxy-3-cyclohexene-1-carboxylate synthase
MARAPDPHAGGSLAVDGAAHGADIYTEHIATPTGLDFATAAALYGIPHQAVADVRDFRVALEHALAGESSSIIEVRGDRAANVAVHGRVWEAVSRSISP